MPIKSTLYHLKGKRIWVAGHTGMVGSAIVRRLAQENLSEILTVSSSDLDLRNQTAVNEWIGRAKPDTIFLAAARVGGIHANDTYPAEFLYDNLIMAANIIHGAYKTDVEKLLFLGSSCIYPKFANQPIDEDALLTGALEPTNDAYAIAKIAGIKLCQSYRKQYGCDFISAMPTNLYGPGDNYHPENSHVLPALIRKAVAAKEKDAKSMEIWGTGTPRREFMHADDCADALIFLMKNYSGERHINVGSGEDITIEALAKSVMRAVGFNGALTKDTSKPDGTPRKLMSNARLKTMGWTPKINLETGLHETVAWYQAHKDAVRQN